MKLKVDGLVFYLGRRGKDGRRSVERVRLESWRSLLPKLREAEVIVRMDGERLAVRPISNSQMVMPFLLDTA